MAMEITIKPDGNGGWLVRIPHIQILGLLTSAGVMWEESRRASPGSLKTMSDAVVRYSEEAKAQDAEIATIEAAHRQHPIKEGDVN